MKELFKYFSNNNFEFIFSLILEFFDKDQTNEVSLEDIGKKANGPCSKKNCLEQLFNHVGPKEHSPEAIALEKTAGFSYRTVLGELMYAYITCRPDIGYAITTLSKFSSAPSAFHYKQF